MTTKQSLSEKRLRLFGRWFVTPFFSVGSGMLTTVAISSFSMIAGLALPWLILVLALVFLAESAISIYLFKDSVPETLVAVFIRGIFKNLNSVKKILLSLGIFCALGGGLALGALTYTSGITAVSAVLGLLSISFPPLGVALAAALGLVAFVAFSCLLIKWIASAIETDIHLQVRDFFKKLVTRDKSKPLAQQILENVFKCLFTFVIIALSIVGTIATLGTMQKGLIQLLTLIPSANLLAVKISSAIISFGLVGIARLPWALQSVCTVFSFLGEMVGKGIFRLACEIGSKLGIYKMPTSALAKPEENKKVYSTKEIAIFMLKATAVVAHGVSFGALARSGGGKVVSDLMTDLNFPLDAATIEVAGQSAAMTGGSMMAAGIGTYSLFSDSIKSAKPPESNEVPLTNTSRLDSSK